MVPDDSEGSEDHLSSEEMVQDEQHGLEMLGPMLMATSWMMLKKKELVQSMLVEDLRYQRRWRRLRSMPVKRRMVPGK